MFWWVVFFSGWVWCFRLALVLRFVTPWWMVVFDCLLLVRAAFCLVVVFGFPDKMLILCLVDCAIWRFCRLDAVLVVPGWVM